MQEFPDIIKLFTKTANNLRNGIISLRTPLEEMVLKASGDELAYVDNRRDAKEKYGHDFWGELNKDWLKSQGIEERLLYSESAQFPDFLFKVRKGQDKLICGSLLELKDSKSGSIASFNSTLPTKYKSLEEIDVINGNKLVSRVARLLDGKLAYSQDYYTFQRQSLYLIRTRKDDYQRVRVSIVDGSFFETIPNDHLIYQMFLNILRLHLEKKELKIAPEILKQVEDAFSHITNHTIISASQLIEKASIKPRLRIMAEVHPEGNPHSSFYPQISEGSLTLILQASSYTKELERQLHREIPHIEIFSIHHKRNGEHIVFQLKR
jgi:hypothetical protein